MVGLASWYAFTGALIFLTPIASHSDGQAFWYWILSPVIVAICAPISCGVSMLIFAPIMWLSHLLNHADENKRLKKTIDRLESQIESQK